MSITRINEFQARDGEGDALSAFLVSLVASIEGANGCLSCRVLRSHERPAHIMMIEEWDSVEAHQASLKDIPPGTFKQATDLLAKAPHGEYYSACL